MNRLAYLAQLAKNYDQNLKEITPTTTFQEMGFDSYAVVDFILQVEEHFSIVVKDEEMLSLHSMQDVMDAIDQCMREEDVKC